MDTCGSGSTSQRAGTDVSSDGEKGAVDTNLPRATLVG